MLSLHYYTSRSNTTYLFTVLRLGLWSFGTFFLIGHIFLYELYELFRMNFLQIGFIVELYLYSTLFLILVLRLRCYSYKYLIGTKKVIVL